MAKFSFFLAQRFFKNQNNSKNNSSNPAIRIAMFGVTIAICTMIISISIFQGFKIEITHKITGFMSPITICDENSFANPDFFPITISPNLLEKLSSVSNIKHIQKYSEKMGVIKTPTSFETINIKGIGETYNTSFIKSCLLKGQLPNFSDNKSSGTIVISAYTANRLNLKVGDDIYTYFFENTIKVRKFKITGIYQTNLKQFDNFFAITDLHTINNLNKWNQDQCSGLEITPFDNTNLTTKKTLTQIISTNKLPYQVFSMEENPRTASIFKNWLSLLDMNIWIILILVTIVSTFLMISGLLILILERIKTIGLLKAFGANNNQIRYIFLYYAILIVGKGLIIGNILGVGLLLLEQKFNLISLNPEDYYVSSVPININILWIIILNLSSFMVILITLLVPSYIICKITPSKTIRFE